VAPRDVERLLGNEVFVLVPRVNVRGECDRAAPGQKGGDPDVVKEVTPGDDVEGVGSSPGIWSVEPFMNIQVTGDQKFERGTLGTNRHR